MLYVQIFYSRIIYDRVKNLKLFNYLLDFISLFDREREHKQEEWQAEGEGEAGFLLSREPNVGLDPRTLANIMTRAKGSHLTHWAT